MRIPFSAVGATSVDPLVTTPSSNTQSATLRVIGPAFAGMRDRHDAGLRSAPGGRARPTMPHSAAGMRTDPPVSKPCRRARCARRPRRRRRRSMPRESDPGRRIARQTTSGVVVGDAVGELVQVGFAEGDGAGADNASTTTALRFGRLPTSPGVPPVVAYSAVSRLSFSASGTPWSLPRVAPDERCRSASRAAARTRSASSAIKALRLAWDAARASSASASASAVVSPVRIAFAASATPRS